MNQQREIDTKVRQNEEMEIDLLELLDFFRERVIVIVLGFLAGALAAGLITFYVINPKYTATAKMYMVSSSTQSVVDLTDLNIGQSLSKDYVELLKTRPIIEAVIDEQGLPSEEAMIIANSLADKGTKELPKLMETPEPHIAEYAIIPVNQSSPSMSRNILIGALIGMLSVMAVFTVQFLLDDTFKSADDIEKEFGVIPLTVIPEGKIAGFESSEKTKRRRRKKGQE